MPLSMLVRITFGFLVSFEHLLVGAFAVMTIFMLEYLSCLSGNFAVPSSVMVLPRVCLIVLLSIVCNLLGDFTESLFFFVVLWMYH